MNLIVQAFGIVGMIFGLWSFQPKQRINILKFQLVSNAFWVLHFGLLGATTGAALNAAGMARAYGFHKFAQQSKRPKWLLWTVLLLITALGFTTWQGWYSLLPMFAMVIATVGLWQRNEQWLRFITFFASPLWITYNILSGSYAGVLTEVLIMCSIIIGLWRYRNSVKTIQKAP